MRRVLRRGLGILLVPLPGPLSRPPPPIPRASLLLHPRPLEAISRRPFCGYIGGRAGEPFTDDEYHHQNEDHPPSSSVANIDEWRWKLSMLQRNAEEQEIISRDRRDRRDYDQIANLAKRMGLYSELYGKVIVASKVPLPNYRPDLDDKRPQREVVIPLSLQRRVEGFVQEHLDRSLLPFDKDSGKTESGSEKTEHVNLDEKLDPLLDESVMEKILQRKSLRMRNFQRTYKEKERLLAAITRNQVIVISGETGCGKTTQLPQFVLESEIQSGRGAFCNIICTQPRRISAMAVAERVSTEEVKTLVNRLILMSATLSGTTQRQLLPRKRKNQITTLVEDALQNSNFETYGSRTRDSLANWNPDCIGFNLIEAVLCHICQRASCSLKDQLKAHPLLGDPNRVLLLSCHGSMATSEQVIDPSTSNVRKVVLATNMAEASITINDIVFVMDCGKAKETTYDALNNTPCLLPSWISKASARQAGRVQPGECYHLYPRCVYDAFAEYQLPELLRTPLNSLCLQIKSLQVGSIGEFLSAALQPPEPRAVQNAVEFLKLIGSLDENENLTDLGRYLSMLPVDPKLGKMLIMGAVFRCIDPILTVVAGLSARDPFLLPQDKKDLAGTAKSRFSAKDYSDHMALVRAYEGWKDAEREGSGYEYCWRNFLSAQTLQAIHSLRKQFSYILKGLGLIDSDANTNNSLSHNQSLVRGVICSGLFPGISSVVHRENSMSFKTMDDGQVLVYANSVNAKYQTIPYPWLVFGEKVKVNAVFIRDSTGVSDSILILFGGAVTKGSAAGHLKMLDGYIDLFMDPSLSECYLQLKEELDKLVHKKLEDPTFDIHKEGKYILFAAQELAAGDLCEGRFVFGRETSRARLRDNEEGKSNIIKDGMNPKSLLQTLLMRAGHTPPKYKTKHLKTNEFRAMVEFKGMQFVGKPKRNKQVAERDAAIEALGWLTQTSGTKLQDEGDDSPLDLTDNMLKLLSRPRKRMRNNPKK
ncbi:hypothetical protein ZWY2020_054938 [Hordeum vulgare]|nr:hypothetical protein ZWY2020_054938 [Hordeum vulgare]